MKDFDVRVSWRPASHDQLCEALRRWSDNAAVGELDSGAHAASVVMHAPSTSIRTICGEVEATVKEVSPSARVQVQARSLSSVLAAMPTPPKIKDDGDEATAKTS